MFNWVPPTHEALLKTPLDGGEGLIKVIKRACSRGNDAVFNDVLSVIKEKRLHIGTERTHSVIDDFCSMTLQTGNTKSLRYIELLLSSTLVPVDFASRQKYADTICFLGCHASKEKQEDPKRYQAIMKTLFVADLENCISPTYGNILKKYPVADDYFHRCYDEKYTRVHRKEMKEETPGCMSWFSALFSEPQKNQYQKVKDESDDELDIPSPPSDATTHVSNESADTTLRHRTTSQ